MTIWFRRSWGCLAIVASVFMLFSPLAAQASNHDQKFSPAQERAIEDLVRQYILKNPDLIVQSIQTMQMREEEAKKARTQQALVARRKDLLQDPRSHVGGNPKGDVTLVEFFDYRCGYCKRVHPTVKKLLEEDGNIRFVYKEFPILGPESIYAARAVVASRNQGKYLEYHNALMEMRGSFAKDRVLGAALSVGLDVEKLEKDIDTLKSDADGIFQLNFGLAQDLDINGTPAFIIGKTVIRGAAELAALKQAVAEARAAQKAKGG